MTNFQQRARTLTLPENLGERIAMIARMAVSEHLRQAIAAANHSHDIVENSASHGHLVIGGVDHGATAEARQPGTRQPGTEAA